MTMPIVDIKVPGESVRDVTRAIEVRKDAFDFPRIFRETVLPWIVEFVRLQFGTQGAHGASGRWADYSGEPKYRAYKQAMVGHLKLLRWEIGGEYEQLYPSLVNPGHSLNNTEIEDDRFLYETLVPHAPDVASDTIGPFGEPSPARPPIAVGAQQRTDLFRDIRRDMLSHGGRRL